MPFIKGIPPGAISSKLVGLLLKEYMSNPAFARERKAIQRRYTGAIKEVAAIVLDETKELPRLSLTFLANDESLRKDLRNYLENPSELASYLDQLDSLYYKKYDESLREHLRNRVQDSSELASYLDQIDSLCHKHGLNYPWAPRLLFCEDIYNAMELNEEQKLIFLSGALSRIIGIPPVFLLPIPNAIICLGTKKEIHEYVNNWLDNIYEQFDGTDNPHQLELHVKWFYQRRVLGKSIGQIAQDYDRYDDSQIKRAIRDIDKRLGGKPRPIGRPQKAKPD